MQIARSAGMVTYPSDFILVAAMNPCPCGYYPDRNKCRCTQPQNREISGKGYSGPILDRIDLCVGTASRGYSTSAENENGKKQ